MRFAALLIPLALSAQPRTLLTLDDFARIDAAATAYPWADGVRTSIVQSAAGWPASFEARYSLKAWSLPLEGGQWPLWYVCPTHGVYLSYKGPSRNECPIDNRNYTGWPFDQVIFGREHSDLANAARDNGIAYRFTGSKRYAQNAADILLAYAGVYLKYPLKDVNNRITASAGRVSAQTLDEANWLIPIVWAYDLIADSGVLDASQRTLIEQQLLRAAASVIQNNDAKTSNWQSWHNAAIGAVGFALHDTTLVAKAIDGPSGFRFQMKNSVLPDGPWFEGAWGYHFYALEPHCFLAEMAARNGIDLYAEEGLRRMFNAPMISTMPDLTLPAFNDSNVLNLVSEDSLYEVAWNRYQDPLYLALLGQRSRGRNALFWGAASIDRRIAAQPASILLPDSGNAFLRNRENDFAVALKFGPHGGGHGHYDKLNFVSYARGGGMAIDPGTQSYAAPTHNTWDKVTLAHNTVVVDEKTQSEATGELKAFLVLPSLSMAAATAGNAYPGVTLERLLLLTPDYLLDIFDAKGSGQQDHKFDWIYHNPGAVTLSTTAKSTAALGSSNGYQYLTNLQSAASEGAWDARFDMSPPAVAPFGSVYSSPSTIGAKFEYSPAQAAGGLSSGKMSYDFTTAQGYILFTAPVNNAPKDAPVSLTMKLYGDNSGHKLALRINDATDERFVFIVGPIDWTGWRQITVNDLSTASHYLGNNDGIFDAPAISVAFELTSASAGPKIGALYADDIQLGYGAGAHTVTDFERIQRNLRVTMAGAENTTIVTGNGLGPDLRQPVPFIMARRQGKETRFISLMEPYGDTPPVQKVQQLPGGAVEITAADFVDNIQIRDDGGVLCQRFKGGKLVRIISSGSATVGDVLTMSRAAAVQIDFLNDGATVDIHFDKPPSGVLKIHAPAAKEIRVDGKPMPYQM